MSMQLFFFSCKRNYPAWWRRNAFRGTDSSSPCSTATSLGLWTCVYENDSSVSCLASASVFNENQIISVAYTDRRDKCFHFLDHLPCRTQVKHCQTSRFLFVIYRHWNDKWIYRILRMISLSICKFAHLQVLRNFIWRLLWRGKKVKLWNKVNTFHVF